MRPEISHYRSTPTRNSCGGSSFPVRAQGALFEGLIPWLIHLWAVLTFIHLQNLRFIVNQSVHSREIIFLCNHVSTVCPCPRKTPASHSGSCSKVPTSDMVFRWKFSKLLSYIDKLSLQSCGIWQTSWINAGPCWFPLCSVYAPGNFALSFYFSLCCVWKLKTVFSFFSLLPN